MRPILSLFCGIGLGVLLSQLPEFTQQYVQRLGGAVDELHIIVTDFDATAAREGLNREEALERYRVNPDTFIVGRGADMTRTIARYERLLAQLGAIEQAGPFARVIEVATSYDSLIGTRALEAYQPAVPVTVEGLTFAGLGFFGGYGFAYGILGLAKRRKTGRART